MTEYSQGTLLLTRAEVEPLMDPPALIGVVERAFRSRAHDESFGNAVVHGDTPGDLEFHIKAGGLSWGKRRYFGLKANSRCFSNRERWGLPNILGVSHHLRRSGPPASPAFACPSATRPLAACWKRSRRPSPRSSRGISFSMT